MSTPGPITPALTGVLTGRARQIVYIVIGVSGLVLGSLKIYFVTTDASQPGWINGALAVLAFVTTTVTTLAASNITPPREENAILDARAVARRDDTDPLG